MSPVLDDRDRAVVNAFQGGFPIEPHPFERAADAMCAAGVPVSAQELLARIQRLDVRDVISRFGPLIDATALGGAATLVAARVPNERFEEVARRVNAHPAVAHNYERDHDLNMWFVVSVVDRGRIPAVIAEIEAETGVETYDLPKLEEFHLGARFPVSGPLAEQPLDCRPEDIDVDTSSQESVSASERRLLEAVQDGLPLSDTPYRDVARDLAVSRDWVTDAVVRLLGSGVIRRVGVVPNHYAIGYTENAMTVWDVPDENVGEVGRAVAELGFVTHCYRRPRHGDVWPYNLFAMVHGRTASEAERRVEVVGRTVSEHSPLGPGGWETVYSTRILKKRGIQFADADEEASSPDRAAAGRRSD